jgi:hypothetical protein
MSITLRSFQQQFSSRPCSVSPSYEVGLNSKYSAAAQVCETANFLPLCRLRTLVIYRVLVHMMALLAAHAGNAVASCGSEWTIAYSRLLADAS